MRVLSAKGLSLVGLVTLASAMFPATAAADDPYGLASGTTSGTTSTFSTAPAAPATWGSTRPTTPADATSVTRDSPVTRGRDMLTRARFLDEAASVDEKAATELTSRLPTLRAAAKTARERADRAATVDDRELLGARAEDLETDVIISEAE